jgi:hypothetical protein
VVSVLDPVDVPTTFTENIHEVFPARVRDDRLMDPVPAVAVTDPPAVTQLPVAPPGAATSRPDGNVSLNAMLASCVLELGLATVKVSALVCPTLMLVGLNAAARVGTRGAGVTVREAVLLVVPWPLWLAEMAPVVLW